MIVRGWRRRRPSESWSAVTWLVGRAIGLLGPDLEPLELAEAFEVGGRRSRRVVGHRSIPAPEASGGAGRTRPLPRPR